MTPVIVAAAVAPVARQSDAGETEKQANVRGVPQPTLEGQEYASGLRRVLAFEKAVEEAVNLDPCSAPMMLGVAADLVVWGRSLHHLAWV